MTATILTLAIGYAVLAVVAGLALISSGVPLLVRALLVPALGVLTFITYDGIGKLRGLPSDAPPPERFRLHWAEIREPDKLDGEPGYIFLWITELDDEFYLLGQPRAHRLPYDRELADLVAQMMGRIADGEEIDGAIDEAEENPDVAERLAEEADEDTDEGGDTQPGERYLTYDFGDVSFSAAQAPVTPEKRD